MADDKLEIVVGVDFSDTGDLALQTALWQARGSDHVAIHAVHVVTEPELAEAAGSTRLEKQSSALALLPEQVWDHVDEVGRAMNRPPGATQVSVHVRFGAPAEVLDQVAIDYGASLIVVGTHGRRGLQRMVLGSVAADLVRSAHCPVLVVRPTDYSGLPRSERPDPPREQQGPPSPRREPHIYVGSQTMWAEHDSEVAATGIRMGR
ncbi:MAG: universal stress protein [Polyangiales bacterium]